MFGIQEWVGRSSPKWWPAFRGFNIIEICMWTYIVSVVYVQLWHRFIDLPTFFFRCDWFLLCLACMYIYVTLGMAVVHRGHKKVLDRPPGTEVREGCDLAFWHGTSALSSGSIVWPLICCLSGLTFSFLEGMWGLSVMHNSPIYSAVPGLAA